MTNKYALNVTQRKQLGSWLRRPPETAIKKYALYTTNKGRNRRGRPRVTYVKSKQKVAGMNNHALIQLAENQEEWRRFVVGKSKIMTVEKSFRGFLRKMCSEQPFLHPLLSRVALIRICQFHTCI